jgi:hypothetical protein
VTSINQTKENYFSAQQIVIYSPSIELKENIFRQAKYISFRLCPCAFENMEGKNKEERHYLNETVPGHTLPSVRHRTRLTRECKYSAGGAT